MCIPSRFNDRHLAARRFRREARIKELQQSAEVAARNMRDLVAEHVAGAGCGKQPTIAYRRDLAGFYIGENKPDPDIELIERPE